MLFKRDYPWIDHAVTLMSLTPFQFLAYIKRILIVEGKPSSEQDRKRRNLFCAGK